uniref:Uncharacterized protein n=1 Tax=Arundo donax TaxID=35708 RepID=A0A0A9CQ39_ARUDO
MPPNVTNINASALLVGPAIIESFANRPLSNGGLTVVVMAQVHFKIGGLRTRLYGINVYCNGVRFANSSNSAALPVPCHD